jgi:predicted negative regulator of RcsB-dependent stress response
MAYDLDEQEQLDQLRAWWAKYGTMVLTVLVVAMAALLYYHLKNVPSVQNKEQNPTNYKIG